MTGCGIAHHRFGLVAVEGGARAMRKYKKLVTKRVDWNKSVKDEDSTDEEKANKKPNHCYIVWEGTVLKPNFGQFRFEKCDDEASARKFLVQHWSEQFWDQCANFTPPTVL